MELLKNDDVPGSAYTESESYGLRNDNNVYETLENNNQEQKIVLYKLQNIIAVVAVLVLIIMDIFQLRIRNIGATEIFAQIQNFLWTDTLLPLVYKMLGI